MPPPDPAPMPAPLPSPIPVPCRSRCRLLHLGHDSPFPAVRSPSRSRASDRTDRRPGEPPGPRRAPLLLAAVRQAYVTGGSDGRRWAAGPERDAALFAGTGPSRFCLEAGVPVRRGRHRPHHRRDPASPEYEPHSFFRRPYQRLRLRHPERGQEHDPAAMAACNVPDTASGRPRSRRRPVTGRNSGAPRRSAAALSTRTALTASADLKNRPPAVWTRPDAVRSSTSARTDPRRGQFRPPSKHRGGQCVRSLDIHDRGPPRQGQNTAVGQVAVSYFSEFLAVSWRPRVCCNGGRGLSLTTDRCSTCEPQPRQCSKLDASRSS